MKNIKRVEKNCGMLEILSVPFIEKTLPTILRHLICNRFSKAPKLLTSLCFKMHLEVLAKRRELHPSSNREKSEKNNHLIVILMDSNNNSRRIYFVKTRYSENKKKKKRFIAHGLKTRIIRVFHCCPWNVYTVYRLQPFPPSFPYPNSLAIFSNLLSPWILPIPLW